MVDDGGEVIKSINDDEYLYCNSMKRKRNEVDEEHEDWEDDNLKVIQGSFNSSLMVSFNILTWGVYFGGPVQRVMLKGQVEESIQGDIQLFDGQITVI